MSHSAFTYRCRLCGHSFSTIVGPTEKQEATLRALLDEELALADNWHVGRLSTHLCANGRYGLADLIGLEPRP